MRVVTAIGYGEPSVLRVEDHPFPEPGPGEAVVEVKAAGINLMDSYMRRGLIPSVESRLRFGLQYASVQAFTAIASGVLPLLSSTSIGAPQAINSRTASWRARSPRSATSPASRRPLAPRPARSSPTPVR